MKKSVFSHLLSAAAFLIYASFAAGSVPTARITNPVNGSTFFGLDPSQFAVGASSSIALLSSVTGNTVAAGSTTITYYFRKQGTSAWTTIGSTTSLTPGGVPGPFTWDFSGIENDGKGIPNGIVYEFQAIASNTNTTDRDPSPVIIWARLNQNPQIINVTFANSVGTPYHPPAFPGAPAYLSEGKVNITADFGSVLGTSRVMNTSVIPSITLTPYGKAPLAAGSNSWNAISTDAATQSIAITTDTGDGDIVLAFSNAVDKNGFTLDSAVYPFRIIIDTIKPAVQSVRFDPNGDGTFVKSPYAKTGSRIYVTFSESMDTIYSIKHAYFTPAGKDKIALGAPTWIGPSNTQCFYTLPVIDDTTGDGPAAFSFADFQDIAQNNDIIVKSYPNFFQINATAPQEPVITFPLSNAEFNENDIIEVKVQTPPDTDIDHLACSFDGGFTFQSAYETPYKIAAQAEPGMTSAIAYFVDAAGNASPSASVSFSVRPAVDTTIPMAIISRSSINVTAFPLVKITATLNKTEDKIRKVEFQYSTDNATWVSLGSDLHALPTPPVPAGGNFKITWDTTQLSTGFYYLRAIATDLNGITDPAPAAVTIRLSKENENHNNIDVVASSPRVDNDFKVSAALTPAATLLNVHMTSLSSPQVVVVVNDVFNDAGGNFHSSFILPSEIAVTGSAGSWDAAIVNPLLTANRIISVYAVGQSASGQTLTRSADAGVIAVDAAKANTITSNQAFGLSVSFQPNALANSTNLTINSIPAPLTGQSGLIALGPTYDLSLASGQTNFSGSAKTTLTLRFPATNGIYQGTNIENGKLTVNYWDDTAQRWKRDKNLIHHAAAPLSIAADTSHFSKFSVIADYAKPVISGVKTNGETLTAKVTDDGSGIATGSANTYLRINNSDNGIADYNPDTDDISFIFDASLTPGTYPYVLHVEDIVGNYAETTGVMSYSGILASGDAHNYPNPFNPDVEDTTIRFTASEDSSMTIKIYDFNGDLVANVVRNMLIFKGVTEWKWGGTNDRGRKVANGVYFAEILVSGATNSPGRTEKKIIKIAVLRRP